MSDTTNLPTYFPMLIIFFIINEAFYKMQLAWTKFVSPIYTLNLQVFHEFLPGNNFIKYQISKSQSRDTFSLRQLPCRRITAYPNNTMCNTCPRGVMFTNHIFERQIQRIFDYSRFSVKGDQDFESRFFKLSFHILIIWNYKLFCFYIIN